MPIFTYKKNTDLYLFRAFTCEGGTHHPLVGLMHLHFPLGMAKALAGPGVSDETGT